MNLHDQAEKIKLQNQKALLQKKNVVGVGLGFKEIGGITTDTVCLTVLVENKVDPAALSQADVIPQEIQGVQTDIKYVGKIVAYKPRTSRWRPAPPGVSIGHPYVTAGTFGAVVRDAKTNKKLLLSNNHVIANSNSATAGDNIIQPGHADGGNAPQDTIAMLERFVKIQFQGDSDDKICPLARFAASVLNTCAQLFGSRSRLQPQKIAKTANSVDAAVARPWGDDAIDEAILEIGKIIGVAEPQLGVAIKKSGRTTGLTHGVIDIIDATLTVGYGDNRSALFEHQFLTKDMSAPGDSGSLGVTQDGNQAIGLLFAGSDEVTVYNPIQYVIEQLGIKFL